MTVEHIVPPGHCSFTFPGQISTYCPTKLVLFHSSSSILSHQVQSNLNSFSLDKIPLPMARKRCTQRQATPRWLIFLVGLASCMPVHPAPSNLSGPNCNHVPNGSSYFPTCQSFLGTGLGPTQVSTKELILLVHPASRFMRLPTLHSNLESKKMDAQPISSCWCTQPCACFSWSTDRYQHTNTNHKAL